MCIRDRIIGVHAQNYSVTQPTASFVLPGDQLSFDVTFDPVSTGNKNARIRIESNDCDESPYVFFIRGRGTPCAQGGSSAISINDDFLQDPSEEYSLQLNQDDEHVIDQLTIQLYPNPNNGRFNLNLVELPEEAQVIIYNALGQIVYNRNCLLYTSPSPRDATLSRMPSSA